MRSHIFFHLYGKTRDKLCERNFFRYENSDMKIPIHSVADLGKLIRATRRSHGLRQDDVAGSAKVGPVFVADVEHGKATVQFGRVLQLLAELGIFLEADVPDSVRPSWEKLQQTGMRPRKPRQSQREKAKAPEAVLPGVIVEPGGKHG